MELELRCSFCQRFLQDPVLLPCSHSVCLVCAENNLQPVSPSQSKSFGGGGHASSELDELDGNCRSRRFRLGSSASTTALFDFALRHENRRQSAYAATPIDRASSTGSTSHPPSMLHHQKAGCRTSLMSNDSCSTLIQLDGLEAVDADSCSDRTSVISETDSGVVCLRSRSASCICSPASGSLHCTEASATNSVSCPACNNLVYLDERGVHSLPKNRCLETLIEKYNSHTNPLNECQLCEGEDKKAAVMICEQCEVSYCQTCLDRCHPLRGPLAKHTLVASAQGRVSLNARLRNAEHKCTEHAEELLSTYCVTCQTPVCCLCIHSGMHVNHSIQSIMITCKAHKTEMSQMLQKLSGKARSGSDFIQQLKKMQIDIKENCLEFEALTVAQCDSLMEAIQTRKRQLLERVSHERQHKESVFVGQIAQSNSHLQKMTGLLQMSIELLKETDPIAFLQISRGLIERIGLAEKTFTKDLPLEVRTLPTFEIRLESEPVVKAIRNLNFYEMKVPAAPVILLEECSADQNTVTVAWQLPETFTAVDSYVLELAEAKDSEFREVFRGTETLCLVEGLHFKSQYLARVKAYNRVGESKYSEYICLQTAEVAWFAFDTTNIHPNVILTNEALTVSSDLIDSCVVLGRIGFSRGIHYWELFVEKYENNADPAFGVARFDVRKDILLGKDDKAWSMYVDSDRSWFMNRAEHHTRLDGGIVSGSIIGILLNLDDHTLHFYVNRKPHGVGPAFRNLYGVFYPAVSINRNVKVTLVTGLDPPYNIYDED